MSLDGDSREDLLLRVHDLTLRLEEAQETLGAIRRGSVDALVVRDDGVDRIYTLQGADTVYRLLFSALSEGVVVLGLDQTILQANERFADLVQMPLSRVMGAGLWRFVAPDDVPRFQALLADQTGAPGRRELRLVRSDGALVPVMVSARAARVDRGEKVCAVVVTDLTELRLAQDALRRANEELEARVATRTAELGIANDELQRRQRALEDADRRKDEFLAMLGHELRNPLAAISSALHLLHHCLPGEPRVRRAADAAVRQSAHMARLLDDLLDVSRITRGAISLREEPVNLAAAVEHAVETAGPLIRERAHELRVSLPPDPVRVQGDPDRVSQIVANLLTNAARYTPVGGQISVSIQREETNAAIRVDDNGVGIAADLIPHVFELFVQADRSVSRTEGGLGIGLTLVKRLTELHGGRVDATSGGPGRGSTFTVWLPILQAGEALPPVVDAAASSGGRRVLVIDDNADAADTLASLLEIDGHEVLVAHDGSTGIEMALSYKPEVALIDIGMPGM